MNAKLFASLENYLDSQIESNAQLLKSLREWKIEPVEPMFLFTPGQTVILCLFDKVFSVVIVKQIVLDEVKWYEVSIEGFANTIVSEKALIGEQPESNKKIEPFNEDEFNLLEISYTAKPKRKNDSGKNCRPFSYVKWTPTERTAMEAYVKTGAKYLEVINSELFNRHTKKGIIDEYYNTKERLGLTNKS